MGIAKRIKDGWENTVTRLGTAYDKMSYHRVLSEDWLDLDVLTNIFYADPFAQRAITEPIEAAFRQGWSLAPPSDLDSETAEAQAKEIDELLLDLDAVPKLQESLCWGQLYGRGGLLIGTKDGASMDEPLDPETIKDLVYLEPLECIDFDANTYQRDPEANDFGEPETWRIMRRASFTVDNEIVHSSRLILTRGVKTSRSKRVLNQWRDASALQAPYTYLRGWDSSIQSVTGMFADSSQAVLKIKGLLGLINDDDTLQNRLRVMEMGKAMRLLPLDTEEDFELVERAFTGADKVLEMLMLALAGALGGIPLTVLFGRSPAGLSATGESDMRLWYDKIGQRREHRYQPALEQLVYFAAIALGATNPEQWGVEFPSLWQMTAAEKATHRATVSKTDVEQIDAGIITADEVTAHRYGDGGWETEIIVDFDERDRLEVEEDDVPPPPPPAVPEEDVPPEDEETP